jgi:hypothetical protein
MPATTAVAKYRKATAAGKHVAASHRSKHRSSDTEKTAKRDAADPITPRTPTDKHDCIAVSQAFYEQAESLASRTRHAIPQEFERVVSQVDELCGEEEFEKARVSFDWMNTCLQNYSKDASLGFCSRNKAYFCAVDPRSEGCQSAPQTEGSPGQARE